MSLLLFPKKKKIKKQNNGARVAFHRLIVGRDGKCMNPDCPCHKNKKKEVIILSAHHIIRRSQGGRDKLEVGITLCVNYSHKWAEGEGNLTDDNGNRITARQFMIMVLDALKDDPCYRWGLVHAELKRREK